MTPPSQQHQHSCLWSPPCVPSPKGPLLAQQPEKYGLYQVAAGLLPASSSSPLERKEKPGELWQTSPKLRVMHLLVHDFCGHGIPYKNGDFGLSIQLP